MLLAGCDVAELSFRGDECGLFFRLEDAIAAGSFELALSIERSAEYGDRVMYGIR